MRRRAADADVKTAEAKAGIFRRHKRFRIDDLQVGLR
jgi:hypothetical protein